ncbi:FeoA family protein, partial [Phaeovulum veldkampii]
GWRARRGGGHGACTPQHLCLDDPHLSQGGAPRPMPGCGTCHAGHSLNDTRPGTTCRIRRLCGCGAVRQRLLDLGMQPDREITVIRAAPLRDPIEVRVGDTFIVLRRREAAQVEVEIEHA